MSDDDDDHDVTTQGSKIRSIGTYLQDLDHWLFKIKINVQCIRTFTCKCKLTAHWLGASTHKQSAVLTTIILLVVM